MRCDFAVETFLPDDQVEVWLWLPLSEVVVLNEIVNAIPVQTRNRVTDF
jgi:hypothetical protein